MILGRLALVAWLVGVSASAAAATSDGILSGYAFTSWSDWAGRPLGSVYAIAQTQDGYLWIGTDSGLLRFDGWRFLAWDTIGDTPLTGSATTLTVARSGELWVGASNPASVARVRNGKLQRYDSGLEGLDGVSALVEDSGGEIWAIADWELYAWKDDRWRKLTLPWKSRPGQVRHAFVSRDDTVWVGTRWGVFRKTAEAADFQLVNDWHVWGLGEDGAGQIWTTDVAAGFRSLDAPTPPKHPLEAAGHRLMYDRLGALWVGTFGDGLWRVRRDESGLSIERAALRTGLSSDSVLSIMEDRDGDIWVGTTVGLHRLTKRPLTPLENVGFVLTVLPSKSGRVLGGTTRGLVELIPTSTGWRAEHLGSSALEVRTLFEDERGTLWMGATDGLWRLAAGRAVHENMGPRSDMLVLSLVPAVGGGFWVGDGQWLYRWTGTTTVPLTLPREAGFHAITVARGDRSQRVWLGSGSKIGFIDRDQRFHVLGPEHGFVTVSNPTLHDVFEDADGVVWLGTSSGLSRFTAGRVASVGRAQGLPGDRVWSITEDVSGDLWLTLDRGIARVSHSDIVQAIANPSYRIRYQMYDPKDGLAGATLGMISSIRDTDGRLWFVRGGGVTEVDPRTLTPRPRPPVIRIEEAVANDRRLDLSQHRLPAGTRRLELSFTALTLGATSRVSFRYRLDGFDTNWVDAGPRRTVFYTNLSPRDYRFRVEARSEDGSWSTSTATWAFTIRPAIYQTGWFYALVAATLVAVTVLAWRFRLALIRRQFSLALAERARLSREIHDTLLQSLVGVALQFDGIANSLGPSSMTAREQLTRIRRQVEAYIREARQSIWDLRSPILEEQDLASALRTFAKVLIGDMPIRFTSEVIGTSAGQPPKVDNQLLRIGQEAITNAVRHARPKRIHLVIVFAPQSVTLRITDDGCGFDTRLAGSDSHYGLITMKERAEELGGHLTVQSAAGRGTSIEATVPTSRAVRSDLPAAI